MNTTESSPIPAVLSVSSGHKRNGKIARLPKALRDKINQWLDDGRRIFAKIETCIGSRVYIWTEAGKQEELLAEDIVTTGSGQPK